MERLKPDDGDVLVFVPGMREMRRIENYLGQQFGQVHLLHAELSKEEQDKTLRVQPGRKIILATNVAESSITIPGIRIVIDSGIQREAKYSPWTGLKTLEDRPTTQSSSIQRAGRAGRTSDGKCFRLYSEQDFKSREAYTVPEILKADLTDTYLLTRRMHLNLEWFTPPPPERWRKAQDLSFKLGAIDEKNELTSVGEKMLKFPLGARLSRILLFAEKYKREEKKKLLGFICDELEKDSYGILKQRLGFFLNESGTENGSWEKALLSGFIDQVAKFRIKQHDFIHYSGKTLKAHKDLKNLQEGYYLILDITPRMEAYLVVPIEEEWLYEVEPFPFTEEESVTVDDVISIRLKTMMGSILIDETHFKKNWSEVSQSVAGKILTQGESTFRKKWSHWSDSTDFLRLHFLAKVKKISWDEVESSINLKDYFQSWNALNWDGLTDYFLQKVLQALQITSIEQELPLKINLGGKRDIAVQYPFGLDPFIEAPIQDFYGVVKTPMILNNTLPLTMKLLGPHKMPIQVTKDIASFWSKTYPEMKKEWQRDYPRHHWPDDPRTAKPILLKRQLESS